MPPTLRISGIEISSSGIKPVTGNLATLVQADTIKEIVVRYGFRSAHPLVQIVIGGSLGLLPLFVFRDVSHWLQHGGTITDIELLMLVPGLIGIWLFVDGFSRGYYLRMKTLRGKRKICFDKRTPPAQVKEFCQQLRNRNYVVLTDAVL